jgi:hypothetical protein
VTRSGGHLFTIALGLAGWTVVVGVPELRGLQSPQTPVLWIAMFIVVILAARALAFRPASDSVLSLDSAYYVAAALCVGSFAAGRIVAVALSLDAAARLYLTRARARSGDVMAWTELGYVLYFGGMSGGLVALSGWLWHADAMIGRHFDNHADTIAIALRVIAVDATLLLSHYAVQGVRQRLLGGGWRRYLDEVALSGITAEASLMPIGVVLVLLYDPDQPLGFVLLSLTYLLINLVFSRLSRTRKQLEQRVTDLEILNATARRLAASLQLEELVEAVAREACKAIP